VGDVGKARAPRFGPFIATGAIVGFVAGSAVAYFGPEAPQYSASTGVGFVGLLGASLGALIGALVALALDRSDDPSRRAQQDGGRALHPSGPGRRSSTPGGGQALGGQPAGGSSAGGDRPAAVATPTPEEAPSAGSAPTAVEGPPADGPDERSAE
jgi:hypothetical protein